MKEYIERAAAIEAIQKYQYPYGVEFLLSNIPAADVAPVVRCRECKFYNKPRLGWCNFHMDRENQDDFCSYGQRKEATHD